MSGSFGTNRTHGRIATYNVLIQEFYGPCEACRSELRQLQPPTPDPLFKTTEKADGSEYTTWAGQLDLSGLRPDGGES